MNLHKKIHRVCLPAILAAICVIFVFTAWFGRPAMASEETYKGLKLFSDVLEKVEESYVDPVKAQKLINGAIQGMIQSLDPHSEFLAPDSFDELQVSTKGKFGGVGIQISMRGGYVTVIAPIMGTPAYKAGIQSGDKIIGVDGESTKDMKLTEAVKKMRGPKGTYVTLTIYREGTERPEDFKLLRDIIPIETVYHVMMEDDFGYIRITTFSDDTYGDLVNVLNEIESGKKPLKGLIIDLRNNPGGLLNEAIDVADLFLDSGVIVSIKGRRKFNTKNFRATPNKKKRDYAMAILINGGSASASEIVAGALQDQKRALILGTTSFGKASVQSVEPLRDGYGLKLTIARYYTPSGRSIQAEGIVPDIEIKMGRDKVEDEKEYHYITEKDLKNHLEAEPNGEQKEKKDDQPLTKDESSAVKPDPTKVLGYLEPLELLKDHQISRALDIIKGHVLLSGSGK